VNKDRDAHRVRLRIPMRRIKPSVTKKCIPQDMHAP
jgi:hypothetical protein